MVINKLITTPQNRGDEFCKPTLSEFDVILQRKATNNIKRAPLLLSKALKGAIMPLFFSLIFKMYEPNTIRNIPMSP